MSEAGAESLRAPAARGPVAAALAATAVTALLLRFQGRRWWCAAGDVAPISADAWGPHNSQHLFDPYSLTHLLHGVLLAGLLLWLVPALAPAWRFAVTVVLECGWEVLENSPFIIDRYRAATAAVGYIGDSVANSMGDVAICAFGFWVARRIGIGRSALLVGAIELALLLTIRDSLLLNVVMLIHPIELIRVWQTGG